MTNEEFQHWLADGGPARAAAADRPGAGGRGGLPGRDRAARRRETALPALRSRRGCPAGLRAPAAPLRLQGLPADVPRADRDTAGRAAPAQALAGPRVGPQGRPALRGAGGRAGLAEADETCFRHSRKGERNMDRKPRRRGGGGGAGPGGAGAAAGVRRRAGDGRRDRLPGLRAQPGGPARGRPPGGRTAPARQPPHPDGQPAPPPAAAVPAAVPRRGDQVPRQLPALASGDRSGQPALPAGLPARLLGTPMHTFRELSLQECGGDAQPSPARTGGVAVDAGLHAVVLSRQAMLPHDRLIRGKDLCTPLWPDPHAPLAPLRRCPRGQRRAARGEARLGQAFVPRGFHPLPSRQFAWRAHPIH